MAIHNLNIYCTEGGLWHPASLRHLCDWAKKKNANWRVYTAQDCSLSEFMEEENQIHNLAVRRGIYEAKNFNESSAHKLLVSQLENFDFLIKTSAGWEPELLLFYALKSAIIRYGKFLELKESAYVVGDESTLSIGAAMVSALGFKKILLIGVDEANPSELIQRLRQNYWGSTFDYSTIDRLTIRPVEASLLVNLLSLKAQNELILNLAYFNFMITGGLFVNFFENTYEEANLTQEAQQAGLRTISSFEIQAEIEIEFAKKFSMDLEDDRSDFIASWFEKSSSKLD